jgi:hypothetical protein
MDESAFPRLGAGAGTPQRCFYTTLFDVERSIVLIYFLKEDVILE